MPRAKGSIGYIEHQSPRKDETGKYLIHPQFVVNGVYDFKDMRDGMRRHHQMAPSQFVAAMDAIKDEMLWALADGMEVKVGNMFVVRPKLEIRCHTDGKGKEWRNTYHVGDRIPANEVQFAGLEVRATKKLVKEFLSEYHEGFSRMNWKVKMPAKDASQELVDITNYCKEHGFITVKDFCQMHGVCKYHARKVLESYCEGEFPKMTRERVGKAYVYRWIGI